MTFIACFALIFTNRHCDLNRVFSLTTFKLNFVVLNGYVVFVGLSCSLTGKFFKIVCRIRCAACKSIASTDALDDDVSNFVLSGNFKDRLLETYHAWLVFVKNKYDTFCVITFKLFFSIGIK